MIYTRKDRVIWTSQHGFITVKSCLTNSVAFHKDVTGLVDENIGQLPITGFSKTFDTASNKILLEKLMKYGLGEQRVR